MGNGTATQIRDAVLTRDFSCNQRYGGERRGLMSQGSPLLHSVWNSHWQPCVPRKMRWCRYKRLPAEADICNLLQYISWEVGCDKWQGLQITTWDTSQYNCTALWEFTLNRHQPLEALLQEVAPDFLLTWDPSTLPEHHAQGYFQIYPPHPQCFCFVYTAFMCLAINQYSYSLFLPHLACHLIKGQNKPLS